MYTVLNKICCVNKYVHKKVSYAEFTNVGPLFNKKCGAEPEALADMLRSISKQSGESAESVLEKKRKVGRICRKSV